MNRQQKIELLKGLQRGKIDITELKPKKLRIYITRIPAECRIELSFFVNDKQVTSTEYGVELDRQLKRKDIDVMVIEKESIT